MRHAALAASMLLAIAVPAHADEFVSLPRVDAVTAGGVDLAVVPYDDGLVATTAVRVDPYVSIALGRDVAVQATWPLTRATVDEQPTLGVGAPSVGVVYATAVDQRTRAVASVAVALAPTDVWERGARANTIGGFGRLADLALGRPSQAMARAGVELVGHRGALALRGGLGLDLGIALGGGSGDEPSSPPIVRAAGGIATALAPTTRVSAELTMLFSTRDHPEQSVSGVVVALQQLVGPAALHASVGLLLDGDARAMVPLVLGLGVEVTR